MPASSEHVHSSRARAVFADIVPDLEVEGERGLERACRAHPDLERDLRALHANWTRVNAILDRVSIDRIGDESASELEPHEDASPRAETQRILEELPRSDSTGARYETRGEIARGGMGIVLRVHDAALDRDLAMKLVRDPGASGRGQAWRRLARFLSEARLAGRLEHPGIVPIHDLGLDAEGRAFFTMPLVRGRKLAEVIDLVHARSEGWTEARALEAVLKVCDTISYAHSVGVVHRDLKPDNVMIGRFGETYVMDWGLARVLARADGDAIEATSAGLDDDGARSSSSGSHPTHDGDVLGTPAYMAPEQAAAQRSETSAQADVYSVGAILYHLLAGRAPYSAAAERRTGEDVIDAVRRGPPEPLEVLAPHASPELVAICAKAMARSRRHRYPDMRAMSEDLRAYMEGRVVHAHEGGAAAELRKWIARNKGLAIAAASALLLAIGGLAAISYVQTSSKNEILKLSDVRRIELLVRQAEALWPAVPEKIGAMEAWLAEAASVLENRALHQRTLSEMRERMRRPSAPESAGRAGPSNADRWRLENQAKLVAELDRLADPDPRQGLIANVRERLNEARTLPERSLEAHAAEWQAAIESIANAGECPLYRGLRIVPQMGLIPIGRDPRSQLWEFAHLASGAPARRAADGTLAIDEETGIVLVLVPGGEATIGSQPPKPGQPADNATDPLARGEELPARKVALAPCFLSKYELSRSQWERWCAHAGSGVSAGAHGSDPALHPARGISWHEATRELEHMGLTLPTEAQWEHAARAGTSTRWWSGNEPRLLIEAENVGSGIDASLPYADAFEETAPIDALRPNPWGLHHVLGNVREWTRDVFRPDHTADMRPTDGLVLAADNGLRTARGGSYKSSAVDARTASRSGVAPENHDAEIGVRPARALEH